MLYTQWIIPRLTVQRRFQGQVLHQHLIKALHLQNAPHPITRHHHPELDTSCHRAKPTVHDLSDTSARNLGSPITSQGGMAVKELQTGKNQSREEILSIFGGCLSAPVAAGRDIA